MQTLVNMHHDFCGVVVKYVPNVTQMDNLFTWYDEYQRMVLWSTYPELNRLQIETIEEMLGQDATAEQILIIMGLEDREEKMVQVINDLSNLNQEEWVYYLRDEMMGKYCIGYWGLLNRINEIIGGWNDCDDDGVMDNALSQLKELQGNG